MTQNDNTSSGDIWRMGSEISSYIVSRDVCFYRLYIQKMLQEWQVRKSKSLQDKLQEHFAQCRIIRAINIEKLENHGLEEKTTNVKI